MRTVLALLIGIAESAFGLLTAAALLYPPLLGYYIVACTNDGVSWAFASLVLLPLAIPPLALLWFVAGVTSGLVIRPFHSGTEFWSYAKWLPVVALACGIATWALAKVSGASARCSFGF